MTFAIALAACAALAAAALLVPPRRWQLASAVAMLGLAVLVGLLALPGAGEALLVGDEMLALSSYARLWLVASALAVAGLALLDAASGASRGAAPAAALFVAAAAAALASPNPAAAVFLALAAGIAALTTVAASTPGAAEPALRALGLAGGLALAGICMAIVASAASPVGLLAGGVVVVAAALRLGVAPFHLPAVRLGRHGAAAWACLPAALAPSLLVLVVQPVLASAAMPEADAVLLAWLVRALAIGGIVVGGIGVLLQDDVGHAVAYAVVAEAAFTLLAFVAPADQALAGAMRVRLLVLPLAAAAAWACAGALRVVLGSSRISDATGWIRVAPFAAPALVAGFVALVGWPGAPSWDARLAVADAAFGRLAGAVVFVGSAVPTGVALARALLAGATGARTPLARASRGQARRRDAWRSPAAAVAALALAVLALAVAAGVGDVAGAAGAPPVAESGGR